MSENAVLEKPQVAKNHKKPNMKITFWCAGAVLLLVSVVLIAFFVHSDRGVVYPVYINEILASNSRFPNADGRCCDFIELYNSGDHAVDISGFQLGDMEGSGRYMIPSGTILYPGEYMTIYCDATADDARYAHFGISRAGGEVFYLIGSNGAIIDQVTTLATDMDQTMIRREDGTLTLGNRATPGHANDMDADQSVGVYNSVVSSVCISELSVNNNIYDPTHRLMCDWIELHNTGASPVDISGFTLSDNVGNNKFTFPDGTVIASDDYLLVLCAEGVEEDGFAAFGLSKAGGETVVLKNNEGLIVEIAESIASKDGSQIRAEGNTWSKCDQPSPGYANDQTGHEAFLASIGAQAGGVVISELMAGSQVLLADDYDDFSDWAELYNTTDHTVELDGWYLSDDPTNPYKWQFPNVQIEAGERLLVYLSGRDTLTDRQIHAGFSLSAGGESLVISSYLGSVVDSVTFGKSENNCSFVCDGDEPVICAKPTPGLPNNEDGYDAFCDEMLPRGELAIWEVMTSNDRFLAQDLGMCYDWVEIKNVSNQDVDLSKYTITDDSGTPDYFRLPEKTLKPGETIAIILSGDETLSTTRHAHAPFSLDAGEDQLLLYGPNGKLQDFVFLKDIPADHSYGRLDGKGGFYYMNPTPERANAEGYRYVSDEPVSQYTAGVYSGDGAFTVPLEAEGNIYYTLDGSDPDERSLPYSAPLTINETTVVRAVSVENGKMISPIYTATFVVGEPHDLPVVSLVTDPSNLWGGKGIYKDNDMDIKEERRFANISYTGTDGTFALDCELSMHGATSLMYAEKKSFKVRFQDKYDGILNYDVFEDGEVEHFSALVVRAAREDVISTHIRDTLMSHIAIENSDAVVSQKYKYIALYLNGEYWGLYAFREFHSADHYGSYMNVPADTVTKVNYANDELNSLNELYRSLNYRNMRNQNDWNYVKSLLDLESFADWIIFEAYTGNFDIHENMRYYYSTADGKWRCGLVDVDLGFFRNPAFSEVAESFHHGKLVSALLTNPEFKEMVALRLAELLEGPLSDKSVQETINMLADTIDSEIYLEAERWGYSYEVWETFTNRLRKFCNGRAKYMINDFCAVVGYGAGSKQQFFGHLIG